MASNPLLFTVVVSIKKTDGFPELREELVGLAACEPSESIERAGTVDLHWGFQQLREAEQVAEALTVLCSRPEMIVLKVLDPESPKNSITFKDERGLSP